MQQCHKLPLSCHVSLCHAGLGLHAPLYLTGNDGTLMSAEKAQELPLHTFQSGPVNSLQGAAQLSGLSGKAPLSIKWRLFPFHCVI